MGCYEFKTQETYKRTNVHQKQARKICEHLGSSKEIGSRIEQASNLIQDSLLKTNKCNKELLVPMKSKGYKETLNEEQNYHSEVIISGRQLYMLSEKQMQQTLHKTIVAIEATVKDSMGLVHGSGVLLSKNIILTVAHMFQNDQRQGVNLSRNQLNKLQFKIYLRGDGSRYFQVQDWVYLKQFKSATRQDRIQFDYALIKLKEKVGPEFDAFLEIALPCECILNKKDEVELNVYGYPLKDQNYKLLDKKGQSIKLNQFGLTRNCAIFQVQPYFSIKYLVSTMPGQSGSPIVANNKIIGIHTGGVQQQFNIGRLVTNDLINNIKQWCRQLKGDPFEIDQNRQCSNCKKEIIPLQKLANNQRIQQKNEKTKRYYTHKVHQENVFEKMGSTYKNQKNYKKALENYIQALKIKQGANGKGCFQSAGTLNNIGFVYQNQQKYQSALNHYNLALEIYIREKGQGCLQSADTLYNIGSVYSDQKKYGFALQYYKLALDIYEKEKEKGCLQSGNVLHNMGLVHQNQQKYKQALKYYSLALEAKRKQRETEYFESASTLYNMGFTYYHLKDYEAAAEYYESALVAYQKTNRIDDARDSAVQLAKFLKYLKKQERISEIVTKYTKEI